jgi:hypothetical protein
MACCEQRQVITSLLHVLCWFWARQLLLLLLLLQCWLTQ